MVATSFYSNPFIFNVNGGLENIYSYYKYKYESTGKISSVFYVTKNNN